MKKILFLMLAAIAAACSEPELSEPVRPVTDDPAALRTRAEHTTFTLEAMRAIAAEVAAETGDVLPELQATAFYVAFEPRDAAETRTLMSRKDLLITPYAFDAPAAGPEDSEQPPKDGRLYALVDADDEWLEKTPCEVLAEFCNPFAECSGVADPTLAARLFAEAEKLRPETRATTRYSPAGRVTVRDDALRTDVPLAGCRILLICYKDYTWITQDTVTTDADGRYESAVTFPLMPTFTLFWETEEYRQLDGEGLTDCFDGYFNRVRDFDIPISRACYGPALVPATIYRAMYDAPRHDFKLMPPEAQEPIGIVVAKTQLPQPGKECVYDRIGHKVHIYATRDESSPQIIARAGYGIGLSDFWCVRNELDPEPNRHIVYSWAAFASWYLLDRQYEQYEALNAVHDLITFGRETVQYPDQYNLQWWTFTNGDRERTAMFIDIYDDFDQYAFYDDDLDNERPADAISIRDMDVLKTMRLQCYSVKTLMDKLRQIRTEYGYTARDVNGLDDVYRRLEEE